MTGETKLKRAILAYLKTLEPEGSFDSTPVSVYGSSGGADIRGVFRGWAVAIEVKDPNGKHPVTENQRTFLHKWRRAGGVAIVAYSVEDVQLRTAGLGWKSSV